MLRVVSKRDCGMKFVSPPEDLSSNAAANDLESLFVDERWRVLGDMIPDGLILIDRSGIVRYVNSAAESITEVSRVMIIGRTLSDLIQHARIDCSVLMDAFSNGSRINKIVRDSDGRVYVLSTRGYKRQWNGESSAILVVLRNLDALAKISSRTSVDSNGVAFVPVSGEAVASDVDPIISGASTVALLDRGLRAIAMGSRLLVLGESGVGKTELARLLHRRSGSVDRPFVHVNCGSIPDSLFESEMFGYERGSFTGASSRGKKGLIEAADGGTLFLDEVGEIPLHCQAKMLQMLEEGLIHRVGATAPRRLRLQVIAATNRDLRTLVEEGGFRRDLYYRLSVVTLLLPPLRERRELIPLLLDRFLMQVNQRRPSPMVIDPTCRRRLQDYSYPGNVRELQNIVEHLAVVCDRVALESDLPLEQMDFPEPRGTDQAAAPATEIFGVVDFATGFDLREAVKSYESTLIEIAIQKTGSKRKAAELLSVDIATVVRKSKAHVSAV